MDSFYNSTDIGRSEKLLLLRYEILKSLRDSNLVSGDVVESVATCLNLATDPDELLEIRERLDEGIEPEDLLWSICECLSRKARSVVPDPEFPPADRVPRLDVLQNVDIEGRPCELKRRLRQALLLINEGCALLIPMDEKELLNRAAAVACRLVSGTVSMAVVVEGSGSDGREMVGACGVPQALDGFPKGARRLLEPAYTGEPLIMEDVSSLPEAKTMPPWHVPVLSAVSIPMGASGKMVGVILVGFDEKRKIDPGDVDMLRAFSRQVYFALQSRMLQVQVRELERLQERQRIAQDLHDTVIQLLFVMGMEAESLMRCCADRPEVFESISRIRKLASRAATELRSAIGAMSLKPATGETSLLELLQEVVEEWEKISGIHVTLVSPSELPDISSEAQRAIYRVVREALVNVQKHARATEVIVSITYMNDRMIVSVQDNGQGFPEDMNQLEPGPLHFGMRNMNKLAEQVGGYIEAMNGDDGGAVVRFVLPL